MNKSEVEHQNILFINLTPRSKTLGPLLHHMLECSMWPLIRLGVLEWSFLKQAVWNSACSQRVTFHHMTENTESMTSDPPSPTCSWQLSPVSCGSSLEKYPLGDQNSPKHIKEMGPSVHSSQGAAWRHFGAIKVWRAKQAKQTSMPRAC